MHAAFFVSSFLLSLYLTLLRIWACGTRLIQGSWPGERLNHEPVFTIWTIMWGRQLLKALGKHSVRFGITHASICVANRLMIGDM